MRTRTALLLNGPESSRVSNSTCLRADFWLQSERKWLNCKQLTGTAPNPTATPRLQTSAKLRASEIAGDRRACEKFHCLLNEHRSAAAKQCRHRAETGARAASARERGPATDRGRPSAPAATAWIDGRGLDTANGIRTLHATSASSRPAWRFRLLMRNYGSPRSGRARLNPPESVSHWRANGARYSPTTRRRGVPTSLSRYPSSLSLASASWPANRWP